MAPKRARTAESELEQVAEQYPPAIKRAECSSVKSCNRNSPVVVFAHGAGAPSTSEWMIRWKNLLANALNAIEVVTFDYPYINGRRKAPPKLEKMVPFHLDIVRKVAAKYPEHPLILVGKSMGSRISCMVAAENDIRVSAIVCLGYPLKATNGVIRDEPLLELSVPIMFVQGGNDNFCPLASLEAVRKKLKGVNDLHIIENGDHSFQIAKKNLELTGMTHEEAEERAAEAVAMFISQVTGEKVINGPTKMNPAHVDDEQESKLFKSSKTIAKRLAHCVTRMRKSERILKNKLKNPIYDIDGRGSTIQMPLNID